LITLPHWWLFDRCLLGAPRAAGGELLLSGQSALEGLLVSSEHCGGGCCSALALLVTITPAKITTINNQFSEPHNCVSHIIFNFSFGQYL